MKKLLFLLLVFIAFLGCKEERAVIINNHSSQTVSGKLRTQYTEKEYSLKPGEQYLYMLLETMTHSMINYISHPIADSVHFIMKDINTYEFFDNPVPPDPAPIPASIYNSLQKDVILSANGALSTDPLFINAGQEITTVTIIKRNPVFKAETTDSYPVYVDFIIKNDMYMIILR